jgi:pimeloyl-ACP methyl ester carboxylesterase
VLRGGQDALIDTGMAARTLAAFTGSRDADLLTWDDVGHSPIVEAPNASSPARRPDRARSRGRRGMT